MSASEYDLTEPERPREEGVDRRPTGWHSVNVGHLVMGIAFVGLVVVWALVRGDVVRLEDAGWILGLPWLAAGAAGLVATVLRRPRDPADHWDPWDHRPSGTMQGWQ